MNGVKMSPVVEVDCSPVMRNLYTNDYIIGMESAQLHFNTLEPVYIEHSREMKKVFNIRRCSMYPGSEQFEVG